MHLTLPAIFNESVKKHRNSNAYAVVGETPITYGEVEKRVKALMAFFEKLSIKPGDKVAILSHNIPNWGISYFAITSMGAIAVPLLPDFSAEEIENILNHSEAKAILVSSAQLNKLESITSPSLESKLAIEDFSLLSPGKETIEYNPDEQSAKDYQVEGDDLAAIIYTSGTTGRSKGVMLTHKNIVSNAYGGKAIQNIDENDRFLSILPLSHTYENTLGLVLPILGGSCVYYIGKTPTPSVLLPALKQVRPTMMLSVPLIIEKIYRNKVLPTFHNKWHTRLLYQIPSVRKKLNLLAGKKLYRTFGGELKFFGIGGAKLDKQVEKFLREARFPYAIGYGLTETSPLLAGANAQTTRLQSTGPAVEGVQLKIHNPDSRTGEGEIWAKGPNVMKGYYKDPEQTAEVLSDDGWFKTGDLGVFDENGFLYIKGRLKNMIVGSNGENIYPEEIESVINNFRHVVESLVVEKKGKLVALVHFNKEELEKRYHHIKDDVTHYVEQKVEDLKKELHEHINTRVNRFSKIHQIFQQSSPFEKTATHKIKRFLYHNKENNK